MKEFKLDFLTTKEAASALKLAPQTLVNWRAKGDTRLPWVKLGRKVVYREEDIHHFVEKQLVH